MIEKGRTDQIIEQLIDSVENGQNVPFAPGKVSVNKEETIRLLRELENIVQGELKIYREVNDRKGKILTEAKKEAEEILTQAEQNASRIRVTKRMSTLPAFHPGDLEPEDREALRTAGDIYAASLIYTDEMLTEVNDLLADSYDLVKQQYAKMVETLEEKTRIVAENKAELMGNLKELSKEERYTLDYGTIRQELEKYPELTLPVLRKVIIDIRESKLPDPKVMGNAGSFFMNPIVPREKLEALQQEFPRIPFYELNDGRVKIPAGWMIDQCGWKGKALGPAAVHDKQALVLVNRGGAKGSDILALSDAVRASVRAKFGIDIHPEVNLVGK